MNFAGKTLLITGGTGSFGSTVLRRLVKEPFKEIRVFSRDEKKQHDQRLKFRDGRIKYIIGDVRDAPAVDNAVRGSDFIYHAAALKQVPSCEFHPMEAVKTNVIGTDNVLAAAIRHNVARVICLSTDKAVYPINAMGISKAMMEKVMVAKAREADGSKTVICGTRYGNVLASRGSVIPVFLDQINAGKPLTLTDTSMTRFVMSLDSAVDLVQYAFDKGRNGDIFVQKAPAATIGVLAKAVAIVAGKPNAETRVIGTRHGEKLYETLLSREELAAAEDLGDYYRVPSDNRDMNYELYFTEGEPKLSVTEDYNSHSTEQLDVDRMVAILKSLPYIQSFLAGKTDFADEAS
jgi:UDP-N-acetylglucosamine 4,6-dehydratase/5-epimerase